MVQDILIYGPTLGAAFILVIFLLLLIAEWLLRRFAKKPFNNLKQQREAKALKYKREEQWLKATIERSNNGR